MSNPDASNMLSTFLRLRADATIEPLPVDETFWPRIVSGALGSFHHEYLVSCYDFDRDWDSWEKHPLGDEIVCLLSGAVTFVLEQPDGERTIELQDSGSFLIVPQDTWHTARVRTASRVLFITAGEGTEHRAINNG